MLLIISLVSIVLVFGYVVQWRGNRTRRCLAHLPTYPELPLIGSAHYLIGDGRRIFLRLKEITDISENSQLPFVLWCGSYCCLILSDLDDIKSVTNEFVEKPYYYGFARQWLGDGIFTTSAYNWKRNIKKLAGTFSASTVENFQDVFNTQAQKLVQGLRSEAGQGPFNVIEKYLAVNTLEAICQIALGVPKISESIVTKEYYGAFMKTLEILQIRGFNILLHSDLLFRLSSYGKEMTKAVKKIHHVSETVMKIRQRRENSKENNESHNTNTAENTKGSFKSYLDILLELNAKDPPFNMEQVRNEVDTIILAGQETVATALYYILLMIGCHPKVQDKLHAEMKTIFGDSNREVDKEDLVRMTYCEAVINETLRLYPPAPAVIRVADHDLQLKSCIVPKGVNCVVNIFGVGRSKRYWGEDAEEFRPERFESGVNSSMIPFSTGKRACIGKKYAISIIKTIIAYCVRELVFEAEHDKIELKIDMALRTVCEKLLKVNIRQK